MGSTKFVSFSYSFLDVLILAVSFSSRHLLRNLKSYDMTILLVVIGYVAITAFILSILHGLRDRNMPETEYYIEDSEKDLPVFQYSENSSNKPLEKVRYA
jgi:hypothetical protein